MGISGAIARAFCVPEGAPGFDEGGDDARAHDDEEGGEPAVRRWTVEERRHVERECVFLFMQAFSEYDAETETREADLRRRHIQRDINNIHELVKGLDKKIV